MGILRFTLLANAIFSLTTGISLVLLHNKIALRFGQQNPTAFWVIGLGLLYFSYSVFIQIKQPKPAAVFFIIIQDLIWVIASIIILLVNPFSITPEGGQAITGVAVVVLLFGAGQAKGLAQIDNTTTKGLKQLRYKRLVNTSKESAWRIISDVANYHKVAPNIDSIKIISGHRKGMVRSCSYRTDRWTEVATLWMEGEQYSFEVDTQKKGYPYPFKFLQGTWQVEAISESKTKVTVIFDMEYKKKAYNILAHPFLKGKFDKTTNELLDNWEYMIENE